MGWAARCGLADGADGEGRSDGDGEGVISGVGIAAGKRRGAVRKKMTGKAETLFFCRRVWSFLGSTKIFQICGLSVRGWG